MDLLHALQQKMHYLGKRQNILSQNIAHANTPQYKAMDLEQFSLQRSTASSPQNVLPLSKTHAIHQKGFAPDLPYKVIANNDPHEVSLDGNNVVLEEQMNLLSDNALQYQQALNLYRKMGTMLELALGKIGI